MGAVRDRRARLGSFDQAKYVMELARCVGARRADLTPQAQAVRRHALPAARALLGVPVRLDLITHVRRCPVNSTLSTVRLAPAGPTRPVASATSRSRGTSSTAFASAAATASAWRRRARRTASRSTRVRPRTSTWADRPGVNQLKPQRSLRSVAEERVGRRCGNLRVLNSYWCVVDSKLDLTSQDQPSVPARHPQH